VSAAEVLALAEPLAWMLALGRRHIEVGR
jgi:hypothetical protein